MTEPDPQLLSTPSNSPPGPSSRPHEARRSSLPLVLLLVGTATLAGEPAPGHVGPGTHTIVVNAPAVADARRALGERSAL